MKRQKTPTPSRSGAQAEKPRASAKLKPRAKTGGKAAGHANNPNPVIVKTVRALGQPAADAWIFGPNGAKPPLQLDPKTVKAVLDATDPKNLRRLHRAIDKLHISLIPKFDGSREGAVMYTTVWHLMDAMECISKARVTIQGLVI